MTKNSAMPLVQPQHRVAEVTDAVAHQRPIGLPIDVVAVGAAETVCRGKSPIPRNASARPKTRASLAVAIVDLPFVGTNDLVR